MAEKKHQILGSDLWIIDQTGKRVGVPLQAVNLNTPAGFSAKTEAVIDSFSDTMKIVEKARLDPESLSPEELAILVGLRVRIR